MGTRSFIARMTKDNTYEGVYCHWDGYLSNNGQILLSCYDKTKKVKELISLGDMSSLGDTVEDCEYYNRDKGENSASNMPKTEDTLEDMMDNACQVGCEYFYLWTGEGWRYAHRGMQFFGGSNGEPMSMLKPLTQEAIDAE